MEEATEPIGIMFCLECMYKHSRDLEHHLEDAYRVTKNPRFDEMIDTLRGWRKEFLEMMKQNPEQCPGCEGIVAPGENPVPELAELERACVWRKEEKESAEAFDPRSFRTLCPECPEARCALCPPELACATRLVIGCPVGFWVEEPEPRCVDKTRVHVVYHGAPK